MAPISSIVGSRFMPITVATEICRSNNICGYANYGYPRGMVKKRPVGRPPLPVGEARGSLLRIRVNRTEEAAMERAAKAAGKPLGSWARDALLDAARAAR